MAPHVWNAIDTGVIGIPTASEENTTFFAKKVPRVSALPMEWIASWLHQNSAGTCSRELLDRIDGNDPENLRNVFCVATKVSLTTPLPRELQHKVTCGRVFSKRAADVGDRLRSLSPNVKADGSIDWPSWGPYKLMRNEEGAIVGIKHIQGEAVTPLPPHMVLNSDFSLNLAWSDFEATLSLGACSHVLHRIFPGDKAPNTEVPGRSGALLDQVTKAVVQDMEAEVAQAKLGTIEEENFLVTHEEKVTTKRKETLEAARRKLAASASRRRSVQISVT